MTTVYPIARGSAPVLVLAAAALLGEATGWWPTVGALTVVPASQPARASPDRATTRGVLMALGVGACIAGYTLVDAHGVDHASPVVAYPWSSSASPPSRRSA